MDWYGFTKKYIWDETKTPYFTAVVKLSKTQAHKEVFAFAFFLSLFFTIVALAAAIAVYREHDLGALWRGAYAVSIIVAAVLLVTRKQRHTAYYCLTAPMALGLHFLLEGFHPNLGTPDKVLILGFLALWLRYTLRIVAITKVHISSQS